MTTSTWTIDPAHSSVIFSIRHLVVARVRGKFSKFGGSLELDEADLTHSSVRVDIDVASIDTSLEPRDTHLKSADFFDVAAFPTATFASRLIRQDAQGYQVVGDFMLRGTTQEVTVKASFGGRAKDARARERVAFAATTSLDREAFGLRWNQALEAGGLAIGPVVEVEIDVEALRTS